LEGSRQSFKLLATAFAAGELATDERPAYLYPSPYSSSSSSAVAAVAAPSGHNRKHLRPLEPIKPAHPDES